MRQKLSFAVLRLTWDVYPFRRDPLFNQQYARPNRLRGRAIRKSVYPLCRSRAAIPVCKGPGHNFLLSASRDQNAPICHVRFNSGPTWSTRCAGRFCGAGLPVDPLLPRRAWLQIAPAPAPSEASNPPTLAATSPAASLQPRFKLAQGFGDQVPLSFAVRQIVPRAVRVTYGPGADPDALVDWKGGQGWNRVLFRAVHPLGLRLVMTYMAVQIRK